jgi:hypothetical protein
VKAPSEAVHLDDVADLNAFEPHGPKGRGAASSSKRTTNPMTDRRFWEHPKPAV